MLVTGNSKYKEKTCVKTSVIFYISENMCFNAQGEL